MQSEWIPFSYVVIVVYIFLIREVRDQGLTRPKILILLPFREAALRTVKMLISLIVPKGQVRLVRVVLLLISWTLLLCLQ